MPELFLALDLGGTKVAWGLLSEDGMMLQHGAWGTKTTDADQLVVEVNRLRSSVDDSIDGVGIAIAAQLDASRVIYAPNLPMWVGCDFRTLFASWDVPVQVWYDGHAAMAGQLWYDRRSEANAAMLVIGTGIGGAIAMDGKILQGHHGLAGMVGTMQLPRGILEDVASGPAVARRAQARDGQAVMAAVQNKIPLAMDALEEASEALCQAIAWITGVLDIPIIYIGGGFGLAIYSYLFPEPELPSRHVMHPVTQGNVRIVPAFSSLAALVGSVVPWIGSVRE